MGIASGTVLVLSTWLILAIVIMSIGFGLSILTSIKNSPIDEIIRRSIWWGLAIFTFIVLASSLISPLRSSGALTFVTAFCALILAGNTIAFRCLGGKRYLTARTQTSSVWSYFSIIVLVIVIIFVAIRALGPANNYDTGLYHLGVVSYFGDYGTIPGLANIYGALGYNNSIFPLAAFLGNGPWDGNGYRLVNGFLMLLVAIDFILRLVFGRKSVGTFLMGIGIIGMFLPLIAVTDFWVTSPTSDSAIMLLALVASAYLIDSISLPDKMWSQMGVVGVVSILLVSMRPTMLFFVAGNLLVLALLIWSRRGRKSTGRVWVWALSGFGVIAVAVGSVQVCRDYFLSGWFLYPLSILPFDVEWRAVDPINLREATLAAARDPSAPEYWPVAHSWNWINEWFIARWSMWETYFVLSGFTALGLLLIFVLVTRVQIQWRRIFLAVSPSVIAVVAWFTVSPPSYRFIWGPLFLTFMIPLAFLLESLRVKWIWPMVQICLSSILGSIVIFTAIFRVQYADMSTEADWNLGPLGISYTYSTPPVPVTSSFTTLGGLELQAPTESEQCWAAFPLCTSNVGARVVGRGPSIQDGFMSGVSGN